jgi:peroxiredoxin Q/BCP
MIYQPENVKGFEDYLPPESQKREKIKEVVKKYGVWGKKKFMGREYMGTKRTSFLIDPKGRIAKIYEDVKPEKHAEEVLKDRKNQK